MRGGVEYAYKAGKMVQLLKALVVLSEVVPVTIWQLRTVCNFPVTWPAHESGMCIGKRIAHRTT